LFYKFWSLNELDIDFYKWEIEGSLSKL
jgi:hypothetical protein